MTPYGTPEQLTDFCPAAGILDHGDASRLLGRASELLDNTVRRPFALNGSGLPTDPTIAGAMRDAACAQVEFWLEVGEEHDVADMGNRQASIGNLSMQALPPELAPRAVRILQASGLLSATQLANSTAAQFFATQSGT